MNLKRSLVASVFLHGGMLFIGAVLNSSASTPKSKAITIETRLIDGKKRKKDLLPRKEQPLRKQPLVKADDEKPKAASPTEKPVPEAIKKPVLEQSQKPKEDNLKKLASLSQEFSLELAKESEAVVDVEDEAESSSYFDQVHTLLKGSFIVPPHLNGPKGERLRVVVKIFIAADGTATTVALELPSGDDHFDRAVLEGAKRISNFGLVPVFLQNTLRERGISVELCPFKCMDG